MPRLQIEHGITSFTEWKTAFNRFADLRAQAGVRRHRIWQPMDDAHYVVIDLDFDSTEEAQAFLETLRERVWPSPQNAPALVGTPQTRILETVEEGETRERAEASRTTARGGERRQDSAPDEGLAGVVQERGDVGQEP